MRGHERVHSWLLLSARQRAIIVALTLVTGSALVYWAASPGGVLVPTLTALTFLAGVALLALGSSALAAGCAVRATEANVVLSFWVFYRARIHAAEVAGVGVDSWDPREYVGVAVKGRRAHSDQGILLTTAPWACHGAQRGIHIATTDGRNYRVQARDPEFLASRLRTVLAAPRA